MSHYDANRCPDILIFTTKLSQLYHASHPTIFKSRWALKFLTYPQKGTFGRKHLLVISNTCRFKSPRKCSIHWKHLIFMLLSGLPLLFTQKAVLAPWCRYIQSFLKTAYVHSHLVLYALFYGLYKHTCISTSSTYFSILRVSAFPTPSTKRWNIPEKLQITFHRSTHCQITLILKWHLLFLLALHPVHTHLVTS